MSKVSFSGRFLCALGAVLITSLGLPAGKAVMPDPPRVQDRPDAVTPIPVRGNGTVAFSHDNSLVATGGPSVELYDVATSKWLARGQPEGDGVGACAHLAFSPDGHWLVAAHDGGIIGKPYLFINLWEISAERSLKRPSLLLAKLHEVGDFFAEVNQAGFSPDSRTVVAGSSDGMIHVWECASGKERLQFEGGIAATYAADGRSLIALTHDGLVRRFDSSTGRELAQPRGPGRTDFIHAQYVAFAANGQRVAVSDGHDVLLQETDTGKRICRLTFPERCRGLALSPDSRNLALPLGEGGICFLDAATGKERGWRGGLSETGVARLAFTADSKTISWAGEARLEIRDLEQFLAGSVRRPAYALSDPPDVPLQAELISKRDQYVLDLGGLTTEEFSRMLGASHVQGPEVDLELRFRNTGKESVKFRPDVDAYVDHLAGAGAMNVQWRGQFNFRPQPGPEPICLAPGESYSVRITKMSQFFAHSYWVLPGEYQIFASCHIRFSPAPPWASKWGSVDLRSPPLKVKVVAARK